MDLALNNLQRLICHKPKQPTKSCYPWWCGWINTYHREIRTVLCLEGDAEQSAEIPFIV